MAATLTYVSGPHVVGDRWEVVYTAALDSSYPTGGYTIKPSSCRLGAAADQDPGLICILGDDLGYGATYDYTHNKVLLYSSAGTQVSAATDVSAVTLLRVIFRSKYRG